MIRQFISLAVLLACLAPGAGCKSEVNVKTPRKAADNNQAALPALGNGGWKDIAYAVGGRLLAAEKDTVFYAFDAISQPGKETTLTAKLQSAKDLSNLSGVVVDFYHKDKAVARARSDEDGLASAYWTPSKTGIYEFVAKVAGVPQGKELQPLLELTDRPLVVAVWPADAKIAVVDLDWTVVNSPFWRVLVGGAKPMAGSKEALQQIGKQYKIVYLTHRPDLLTRKSKDWLRGNGFPISPLLSSQLQDVIDSGKFKTVAIKTLMDEFANVSIGIGDKVSDAQAYVDNGLTAYLIPHYDAEDADEMRQIARQIRQMRGNGRLNVVTGWEQVQAGILEGKKYPPDAYARWLENRADQIRREKREEEDDDD